MKTQTILQEVKKLLADTNLKINLTPELRVKHGIYSLIEKGRNSPLLEDEDTGEEILDFTEITGDFSDEPDNNFLEIVLNDEAISFWIAIIAEEFSDAPEYVTMLVDDIKSAQKLGFWYVRLTQY
jgi:hypothetical protein